MLLVIIKIKVDAIPISSYAGEEKMKKLIEYVGIEIPFKCQTLLF